ncbi:hypothetical protein SAMN04489859_10894 [Paracoccus alcaliphilus]|uniref:Uncharacterized protein n=1 Tax=Paracoccus alcaliphilus TaxID=34002 RepID=A0A1H8PCE9_9RHOB|nr:hypothetical protein SAMN04489859_10894 [Paracoccus alcaliphilus]
MQTRPRYAHIAGDLIGALTSFSTRNKAFYCPSGYRIVTTPSTARCHQV